jgi:hypothetical protein
MLDKGNARPVSRPGGAICNAWNTPQNKAPGCEAQARRASFACRIINAAAAYFAIRFAAADRRNTRAAI